MQYHGYSKLQEEINAGIAHNKPENFVRRGMEEKLHLDGAFVGIRPHARSGGCLMKDFSTLRSRL
jgi:hypothetical protein